MKNILLLLLLLSCTKQESRVYPDNIYDNHMIQETRKSDSIIMEAEKRYPVIKSRGITPSADIIEVDNQLIYTLNKIQNIESDLQEQNDLWDVGCAGYSKAVLNLVAGDLEGLIEDVVTLEAEFESFINNPRLSLVYNLYKPYIEAEIAQLVKASTEYLDILNEQGVACGTNVPRLDGRTYFMKDGYERLQLFHRSLRRYI